MKTLILILLSTCFAFAQSNYRSAAGMKKPDTTYRHTKDGFAITAQVQASIKEIDTEMKKYEDVVKEYNRLALLKRTIYKTLIEGKGYSLESLVGDPIITADSIKMIIVFPRIK